jgi:hypothetical protein
MGPKKPLLDGTYKIPAIQRVAEGRLENCLLGEE